MEHHLRLAQARGSLVAPNSPVQDLALQFLALDEARYREQERYEDVRRLMVSNAIENVHRYFPEYFPADFEEQLAYAKATKDGTFRPELLDDSALEWRAEGITAEEDDEISRWVKDREGSLSLSIADADKGWV